MDKLVGGAIKKVMGEGEKKAPVKSIKLKVKFAKVDSQKKEMAKKMKKSDKPSKFKKFDESGDIPF